MTVNVLKNIQNTFITKNEDLEAARLPPLSLERIPNSNPVNLILYKHSKEERGPLDKILDDLISTNILEDCPDHTEFASPVFLVKNKD